MASARSGKNTAGRRVRSSATVSPSASAPRAQKNSSRTFSHSPLRTCGSASATDVDSRGTRTRTRSQPGARVMTTVEHDPEDEGGDGGDDRRQDGLPPPVRLPLPLPRRWAGRPPGGSAPPRRSTATGGCASVTVSSARGRRATCESHCSSSSARVPSARSCSTAWLTQLVSGEPLSSTRPNCSGTAGVRRQLADDHAVLDLGGGHVEGGRQVDHQAVDGAVLQRGLGVVVAVEDRRFGRRAGSPR